MVPAGTACQFCSSGDDRVLYLSDSSHRGAVSLHFWHWDLSPFGPLSAHQVRGLWSFQPQRWKERVKVCDTNENQLLVVISGGRVAETWIHFRLSGLNGCDREMNFSCWFRSASKTVTPSQLDSICRMREMKMRDLTPAIWRCDRYSFKYVRDQIASLEYAFCQRHISGEG